MDFQCKCKSLLSLVQSLLEDSNFSCTTVQWKENYKVLSIDLMPQLSVRLGRNLRSTASSADAWFFPSPVCRIIFPFVIQMTPLPRELQSSVGPLEPGIADPLSPPDFDRYVISDPTRRCYILHANTLVGSSNDPLVQRPMRLLSEHFRT